MVIDFWRDIQVIGREGDVEEEEAVMIVGPVGSNDHSSK